MLRNLLRTPLFLGIILIIFVIGIVSSNGPSSEDNQMSISNSDKSLFIDQQIKTGPEAPDLTLIQKNSLAGVSCPQIFSSKILGNLIEGDEIPEERREITEYIVQSGDSLELIAANFDISLNTLLWANDLNKRSIIRPGQKLVILPVSGVIHHIIKGDTLSEVAETYKAKTSEIIVFNDLFEEGDVYIGDILIIPNGTKPVVVSTQPSQYNQIPVASSYFIYPLSSPFRVTQSLHWYNAIDFSHQGDSCGKPVFTAAGGEVLKVKYGYNMGAGNYIRILHPNGLITHYGHLQSILVGIGDRVFQGDIIGLTGHTGKTIPQGSTGCHLHFALYSSQGSPPTNPFYR